MSTIITTDFQLPTTVISNGAVTGNQWSNPNNLLLTDGDTAQSSPGQGAASDVVVGNFNAANVPTNAIITGIEIELIGAYAASMTSPSTTISPYFLDDTSGSDVYYPYVTPQVLSTTPSDYVLGSPNYLFASSFTPDQINNAKIQLLVNGDVFVDAVKIKVYYYIPDTPTPPTPIGMGCVDCNSPIQVQPLYLALPFLAGDRYAYIKSFNYPDRTPVQYADLGSCGGVIMFVFDPSVPKIGNSNFEENAMTSVWTTLPNGTVQLDFNPISSNRGLQFHTPYTAVAGLRSNHDANSQVIISDSGPFLGQQLRQCQIGSVVSAPIHAQFNGADVVFPATKFNFSGAVQVTQDGLDPLKANIYIPGVGTTPPIVVGTGGGTTGNTQQLTLEFDIPSSGVNRGSLIQISTEQSKTIVSVTGNLVAFSPLVIETDVANNLREEQWGLVAPVVGTLHIIITMSAPAYITARGEVLIGVDQGTPFGSTQNASGSSLTPLLILTTTYDNSIIVDGLGTAQTPILYTPGPGQISNGSETANGDTRQGGSSYTGSGTAPDAVTMQYAITQNTPWVYTAVEVKGITSAPPVVTGITVQDTTPNVVVPNTVKIVVPDGVLTNPFLGQANINTTLLKATVADTTPDYLDPKINLHSSDGSVSVTKSITNPAGNEVLDYDLKGPTSLSSIPGIQFYFPVNPQTAVAFSQEGQKIGCDMSLVSPTYYWLAIITNAVNTITIYRMEKQASGSYVYKGINTTVTGSVSVQALGITETGGKVYLWWNDTGSTVQLTQFTTSLTTPTTITGFSTAFSATHNEMTSASDGSGKLWILESTTDVKSYTVSGTVATLVDTITLGSALGNNPTFAVDTSENIFSIYDRLNVGYTETMKKYDNTGALQSSINIAAFAGVTNIVAGLGFVKLGSSFAYSVMQKLDGAQSTMAIVNSLDLT